MKCIVSMLAMTIFLLGCSSEPVPEVKPAQLTFSLFADNTVNPNTQGDASPVEIQVFELRDDSMLLSSDYVQLQRDYKKSLRNNFIKAYDYVLIPGQFKYVNQFFLDDETNYIGVIAHFSDPENSDWKQSVKVINKNNQYNLFIYFKDYEVILKKVE